METGDQEEAPGVARLTVATELMERAAEAAVAMTRKMEAMVARVQICSEVLSEGEVVVEE
jgi:hypothetical protein